MKNNDSIFDNEKNWTNLEIKVKEFLELKWWEVEVNQPYIDTATLKQRDIDIVARKKNPIQSMWITTPTVLEFILVIDCKNLPFQQWIYSQKNNIDYAKNVLLWNWIYRNFYSDSVNIKNTLKHRYLSNWEVIYNSTKNDDNGLWISRINQVLSALNSNLWGSKYEWNLKYPIIVLNSFENLKVRKQNNDETWIDMNFLYQRDFITNNVKRNFFVDIVSLWLLEKFLIEIEEDSKILQEAISKRLFFEDIQKNSNPDQDNYNQYY